MKRIVCSEGTRVNELIEKSRHKDKILHLLENLGFGYMEFDLTEHKPPNKSNCHGTTAYVLGIEDKIVKKYKDRTSRYDFYFPEKIERPGYIGSHIMEDFLFRNKNTQIIDKDSAIDEIVSFSFNTNKIDGELNLAHTGIFLGEIKGVDFIFHQTSYGGIFDFCKIERLTETGSTLRYHTVS